MGNDLRHAVRSLLREPVFAAVAILTLALGVGANTAIFSIIDRVLLRPLAYRAPGRLVTIAEIVPFLSHLYPALPVNARHYLLWRERCSSFEQLAILRQSNVTLTGADEPERLTGARVSASFLPTLGVQPALGRNFTGDEDRPGHSQVAIVSDSLWRRRFHGDPALLGKTITLDERPHLVIGILPPWFRYPALDRLSDVRLDPRTDVLRPFAFDPNDSGWQGDYNYGVVARLKPGVTREQARAEVDVAQGAVSVLAKSDPPLRAVMQPLAERIVGPVRRGLLVLLAAIGSVLLIVCVNLANLMLARGTARWRDAAIRTALGASRWRVMRETLVSSFLLAVAGGALGVALAYAGLRAPIARAPVDIPRLDEVRLDWRVMLFALAISTAAGLLFGILPAWRAGRIQPQDALKSGSRTVTESGRGLRLRDALVSLEVGLSAVLLILAALLMGSFARLMQVDKGFQAERVLAVELPLSPVRYKEMAQRDRFFEEAMGKVRALPGVVSAGLVSALPLKGETWVDGIHAEGDARRKGEEVIANYRFLSAGYFEAMRIPLLAGRYLQDSDRGKRVALVAERTAQRVWPGENPIGKRFRRGNPNEQGWEVIGVVKDTRVSLQKEPVMMAYVPYWSRQGFGVWLVLRTAMDPRGVASAVRSAIWSIDAEAPVPPMKTMEDVLDDSVAQRRFQMLLTSLFAGCALFLASLGIYGVVSYSVARRTNEMGIRMALGAGAADIRRMVLRQGLLPVWIGLALGIAAALALGRIVASLLYGISATDPAIMGGAAALLLLVAAAACYLPARRATRVDPIRALRYE